MDITSMATSTATAMDVDDGMEIGLVSGAVEVDASKKRSAEAVEIVQEEMKCCQCDSTAVKYRCPRCERITCSLACCVAHKKEYDCNGKRDRTKFIPTKQFTDANLASDFFFLEEVTRSTQTAARSRSQLGLNVRSHGHQKPHAKKRKVSAKSGVNSGPVNPHVPSDWLSRFPVAFQLLVQHAAKRGVALTLLAPGMSKRVRNTSFMNTKESTLFWRIEWSFPSAEVPVSLHEERAEDSLAPFDLLAKYLDKRLDNTNLRNKLKKYATTDWRDDIVLLLRKEFAPSPQPQFYRLDGHQSIESNLKRKAVVEFPVILVVLRSELPQYTVVNDLIEVVEAEPLHTTKPSTEDEDDDVNEEHTNEETTASEDCEGDGNDDDDVVVAEVLDEVVADE